MFKSVFKNDYYAKKTFTYYIPSPPNRKSGYQEREFDAITEYITALGFELISFTVQGHTGTDGASGMWVICLLGAPTKDVYNKKINYTQEDLYSNNTVSENSIPLDPSITHEI